MLGCLSNHPLLLDVSVFSHVPFYCCFTRNSHRIRVRNLLKFRSPKAVRFNTFILLFIPSVNPLEYTLVSSIRSAKEHKLLLVKYLPSLIQNATNISDKESSKKKHHGEHFYYLSTSAIIKGEKVPVNITLIKRNNRSIQYYNHTLPSEEKKKEGPLAFSEPRIF